MERKAFLKLIGADSDEAEYIPVAFLLKCSYAGIGFYNGSVNEKFADVCVFLNARLVNLVNAAEQNHASIRCFTELIEEISLNEARDEKAKSLEPEFGSAIPIIAVPLSEFAVIYPVSQIRTLVNRSKSERGKSVPTFFDLEKSEILALLRIKLW